MATNYMSMDNLKFLLYEVHQVHELLENERFQDFDMEGINLMLESAKDMADQEMYPCFVDMDRNPARYEDGKVIAHPQLGSILQKAAENGWIGTTFDYDHGGMQMPSSVFSAANHIFQSANNHAVGYIGLTTGAANLIVSFAKQELIDTYVPNMLAGKWMGTMALTEPQAGSSLSDIVTSATPTDAGYYKISGQKIFISGGDHQHGENFIHLMLARIDGAPAGTKGISLFVVPKYRPEEDGSMVYNDVTTVADFEKMGQKGYVTTHLMMGEANDCRGWLVGNEHQGLRYMFKMMNGARIDVGLTATSTAAAAYYASLQYAQERPQGRKLTKNGIKDLSEGQTLIINHPDVRRMLWLQKAVVEGSLSLLLECTRLEDLIKTSEGEEQEDHHLLLEILTPIAKTYPSEMGRVSISNGLQILGGYGFCMDFPLQQYYRDIRIMALYEGTTGIQSLDLLGRKITINKGRALKLLTKEIQQTLKEAGEYDELKPIAKKLGDTMGQIQEVLQHLMQYAMEGNYELFLADATTFMEMMSVGVVGWQWLKQGIVAKRNIIAGNFEDRSQEFYESKLHTMKFYFKYEIPKTLGLAQILMDTDALTLVEEKELIV